MENYVRFIGLRVTLGARQRLLRIEQRQQQ